MTDGRYLNELVGLTVGAKMLEMGLFPNAKEVSESFSAYAAARAHLPWFSLGDPGVTLVAVGDGCTPRTGATFAMRSAWRCFSVDPALRETGASGARGRRPSRRWNAIERLTVLPERVEDVAVEADRAIIVAVHSHACLAAALRSVRAREIAVVAMPCCVPQRLSAPPDVTYDDPGVWSPQRTVMVWRNAVGAA